MIKALRRKFIATAMCAVIIVLFVIVGAINLANCHSIIQNANSTLDILCDNGGMFPKSERRPDDGFKENKNIPEMRDISPEAPFQTRYFSVTLGYDGSLIQINTGRIAAVSDDDAIAYAEELFEKGSTDGFADSYKYRRIEVENGVMYVFLDCQSDLSTFYSFLLASILISLAGVLFVFVLVLIFSKILLKPVAESYEKQKRFITDASHELKTPLTIIDANTEVLEMENGENEWTQSTRNQIKRLSSLTEKLVFLSRMDEENTRLNLARFSISDAVYEAAQPFEGVAAAHGKHFSADIDENLEYKGDEALIRQLVSLLLDNAVKYSNEGGFITLSLKGVGKGVELSMINTVDEIEKGNLDILFERFFRPDSSRNSQTGGSGIGLSAAKAIVTAHKGKITAYSNDGKSVFFNVFLPNK